MRHVFQVSCKFHSPFEYLPLHMISKAKWKSTTPTKSKIEENRNSFENGKIKFFFDEKETEKSILVASLHIPSSWGRWIPPSSPRTHLDFGLIFPLSTLKTPIYNSCNRYSKRKGRG